MKLQADNNVDDPETNKLLKSALLFKFAVVIFTFSIFLPKEENQKKKIKNVPTIYKDHSW